MSAQVDNRLNRSAAGGAVTDYQVGKTVQFFPASPLNSKYSSLSVPDWSVRISLSLTSGAVMTVPSSTTWTSWVLLTEKISSPLYWAVIVCEPALSVFVLKMAWAEPSRLSVPSSVLPSIKVTVPEGVNSLVSTEVTWVVKVTLSPTLEGLRKIPDLCWSLPETECRYFLHRGCHPRQWGQLADPPAVFTQENMSGSITAVWANHWRAVMVFGSGWRVIFQDQATRSTTSVQGVTSNMPSSSVSRSSPFAPLNSKTSIWVTLSLFSKLSEVTRSAVPSVKVLSAATK